MAAASSVNSTAEDFLFSSSGIPEDSSSAVNHSHDSLSHEDGLPEREDDWETEGENLSYQDYSLVTIDRERFAAAGDAINLLPTMPEQQQELLHHQQQQQQQEEEEERRRRHQHRQQQQQEEEEERRHQHRQQQQHQLLPHQVAPQEEEHPEEPLMRTIADEVEIGNFLCEILTIIFTISSNMRLKV